MRDIRFNLGKRIGRSIRETYEKSPEDFWYRHNGISLVCDSLARRNGRLVLENPSVINGAQTLYAIHGSVKTNHKALVTVRVLVRHCHGDIKHEDDQWLQGVIRGVNTQNKVQSLDFFANEPEQFELQRLWHPWGVFYERKRGEWNNVKNNPKYKSFRRLSLGTLARILMVTLDDSGRGVLLVKGGLERAFQDRRHYDQVFGSKKTVKWKFKRFYLAYRLFRFLSVWGYKDAKTSRKQRHGFWNCLWICCGMLTSAKGIPERCSVASISDGFDAFESRTQVGRHARKIIRQLTAAVWRAYRKGRAKDREHWTPNNFFKEKYGNECLKRWVSPAIKKDVASLAKYLLK